MTGTELKTKSRQELDELLRNARGELRDLRFHVHRGEEKQVRKLRLLRHDIARLLTILKQVK